MNAKIAKILKKRREISLAYLFGSVARKTPDERSDIDIAVLLKNYSLVEKNPFYEAELALEIEKVLKIKNVDIRVINKAPIRFIHQVLKHGKLLFARNEKERVEFETESFDKYFDFKPFIEEYDKIRAIRLGV